MLHEHEKPLSVSANGLPPITTRSPASAGMVQMAQRIAPTGADVLLQGERGTGKRLLCGWIHHWSLRRGLPLVSVDCSASTEVELEGRLFGVHKTRLETDVLRLPQVGSLLLSEVGEMPLRTQAKLLWAMDAHDLYSGKGSVPRVRVLATSSRPLHDLVSERAFRADLYFRLRVIPIDVPPLRARTEDIPALAEQFLAAHSDSTGRMKPEFVAGLLRHSWPGNVSELQSLMRRAAVLCSAGDIGPEFLDFDGIPTPATRTGLSWREAERRLLEQALAVTEGNRTRAAEMLGLSVRTVRNKIRDFGLGSRGLA